MTYLPCHPLNNVAYTVASRGRGHSYLHSVSYLCPQWLMGSWSSAASKVKWSARRRDHGALSLRGTDVTASSHAHYSYRPYTKATFVLLMYCFVIYSSALSPIFKNRPWSCCDFLSLSSWTLDELKPLTGRKAPVVLIHKKKYWWFAEPKTICSFTSPPLSSITLATDWLFDSK